jgi:hypothetical protein
MRIRRPSAVALSAALAAGGAAPAAQAAPATVQVRIEGMATTIFEGPVLTDGMAAIRAPSDSDPRRCDGTNNGAHATPGPTPTTAALTALASIGRPWDGEWYPGFEDYFITQLGERQDEARGAYWGVLVNGAFTSLGGCQRRIDGGDEVLWALDAFGGTGEKSVLRLAGPAGAVPGQPVRYTVTGDGAPFAGASVGGVAATGADGGIDLIFDGAGWRHLKADSPRAVRSARLDVCVRAAADPACDALGDGPPPRPASGTGGDAGGPPPAPPTPTAPPADGAPAGGRPAAVLRVPGVATSRSVRVRWSVSAPGAAVRSWMLAGRRHGARAYRVLARGTSGKSTVVRLRAGLAHDLRLVVVDAAGTESRPASRTVAVPLSVRGRGVRREGRWRRSGDALRGGRGARLSMRLAAGTPIMLVRGARRGTRLEIRAGSRRRVLAPKPGRRQVAGPRLVRPGRVAVRVLRGTVSVRGIAPAP